MTFTVKGFKPPKNDPTVPTTVAASTAFLYEGENPPQTGVAPGTITSERAAVVRGRVTLADGTPVAGVTVHVLDHPEFGRTETRPDGWFDMAANGGGLLRISYEKQGYLQRGAPGRGRGPGLHRPRPCRAHPLRHQGHPGRDWVAAEMQVAQGSPVS